MAELDTESRDWLTDRTMRLLCAAMDRDPDETVRLLEEIADEHGQRGMFGVCCAMAETVRRLVFPQIKGDGSLTGDMLAIEKLPGAKDDRYTDWAARFVAALFLGSLGDEDLHAGGVASLVAMAADIARQKEAERGTEITD